MNGYLYSKAIPEISQGRSIWGQGAREIGARSKLSLPFIPSSVALRLESGSVPCPKRG
ncbi:unnamed protein product [marine sediment metagenome]|uniref:Uncharacterized protein n=1 Tax=marine sediment metagenome TaxID=412755 RepID=X1FES1_9ZZZZ